MTSMSGFLKRVATLYPDPRCRCAGGYKCTHCLPPNPTVSAEAGRAGDKEMVKICRMALQGNAGAKKDVQPRNRGRQGRLEGPSQVLTRSTRYAMTNEEFHGMLMAALHGPHANEIAGRVLEVALSDTATETIIGTLLEQVLSSEQAEHVLDLEMLAHLEGLDPFSPRTRDSLKNSIAIEGAKVRTRDRIRGRLRETTEKSDAGRTVAASIFLDRNPQ